MKIYTSEVSQFGRELKILNEKVKFDGTGCAEVDDKLGKSIIEYSSWYSQERPALKPIKPKEVELQEEVEKQNLELLQSEIVKLEKSNDSRKERIKSLEKESEDIRGEMQKVVEERDELKKREIEVAELHKKEIENLNYKCELSLMEIDELKAVCEKMGLAEGKYKNKKSKKALVELILRKVD